MVAGGVGAVSVVVEGVSLVSFRGLRRGFSVVGLVAVGVVLGGCGFSTFCFDGVSCVCVEVVGFFGLGNLADGLVVEFVPGDCGFEAIMS